MPPLRTRVSAFRMTIPPRVINYLFFAAICAIYVAARFWRLTDSCLWFDEIFSVHAAELPWNELFNFVALDLIHPPLFYVRLKLWMDIVGDGVFWLRLLPVIISCIAIVPFLLLCRELKLKTSVTALTLFLLAVNGSLIKYAQEVRMYSLLMCLSLFSMWLFARYFNRRKSFVWLLIVNILLVYSHYFGWFVVLAEVVAILSFQRAKWRQIVAMFGIVFASFLPWVIAVWRAAMTGVELRQNIGWVPRPAFQEINTFIFDLIEPFYYQAISITEPPSIYRVSIPVLLILLIAVVLYVVSWTKRPEEEKVTVSFLSIFAGLPLIAAFVASWLLPYSVWGTRHLIIVFAPAVLLLATALANIPFPRFRIASITLLLLFTGYAFALQAIRATPQYLWCAWEPLGREWVFAPHYSSQPKTVYALEEFIGYHLWFAVREFPNNNVRVVKNFGGNTDVSAYFLPRGFDQVQIVDVETAFSGDEFWVAFRDPDLDHDFPGLRIFSYRPRVLNELDQLGYEVQDTRKIRVGNESAFLVKMIRRPPGVP